MSGRLIFATAVKSSVIVRGCKKITAAVNGAMLHGFFGSLFTSYFEAEEKFRGGVLFKTCSKYFAAENFRRLRYNIAKMTETSAAVGFVQSLLPKLMSLRLRVYGMFFAVFGIYSAMLSAAGLFFESFEAKPVELAVSLCIIICALPMLFSRKSLAGSFLSSRFFYGFITKALGVRTEILERYAEKAAGGRESIGVIFGIIAGCVTFFIPPYVTLGLFAVIIAAAYVLYSPETGVILLFAALPLLQSKLLVLLILYTAAAYLFKLIRGKRTFKVGLADVFVFLYAAVILCGGLFSFAPAQSGQTAKLYLLFILAYYLTVNLICTRTDLARCTGALLIGAAAVSLYGVYQYIYDPVEGIWLDTVMFSEISSRITATFDNPNMFAEFLEMVIPFAFASTFTARHGYSLTSQANSGDVTRFTVCALCLGCLVLTWSRGAWLGFVFGMAIFLLTVSSKSLFILIGAAAAVPFWALFLPASVYSRLTSIGSMSDTSTVFRVNVWRSSVNMLKKYALFGIGTGDSAFACVFPAFAYSGVQSAVHSHNLYLQILTETGIVGVVIFFAMIFVLYNSAFSSLRYCRVKTTAVIISAATAGISAILLHGIVDHVFYNMRIFLLFMLAAAIIGAGSRIVRRSNTGSDKAVTESKADIEIVIN